MGEFTPRKLIICGSYIFNVLMFLVSFFPEDNTVIWQCIESKMKITVPRYIKLILMYCGFNDCHAIAAIEQSDLNRFINEVRQGNVTNFYLKLGVNDALGGSREREENFVFVLGHERLLMAVVNFVKQNLSDYDDDTFSTNKEADTPKTQKLSLENFNPKITNEQLKELKLSKDVRTNTLLSEHYDVSESDMNSHRKIVSVHAVHESVIKHQYTLLTMVVTSLSAHTPKMYQEVSASLMICYALRL